MPEYKFTEIQTERFEEREVSLDELILLFRDSPDYRELFSKMSRDEIVYYLAELLLEQPTLVMRFGFIIGKTNLRASLRASKVTDELSKLDKGKLAN